MQIINDPKLDFSDVLIVPKVSSLSSRNDVSLKRTFRYIGMNGDECYIKCVPIIASNMDGVGTFSMAKALYGFDCLTALTKHSNSENDWKKSLNEIGGRYSIYSIGMPRFNRAGFLAGISKFFWQHHELKILCIDVANGYNSEFVAFVAMAREFMPPDTFIIAGNVVTAPQTEQLILAGANAVKVGIGSGSVCTTRKVTGVGYPQLSAVIECGDAAHGLHGFIVSDGGCKVPGDVCKAFGAGADFVMLGGMLAGHEEWTDVPSGGIAGALDFIEFHGSSSKSAQELHNGELLDYRASEGKKVEVPYRGPVKQTMEHILGGLRSACTYVGARELKEFSKRTTFIRVQNGYQYNTVFGDATEVT